MIGGVTYNINHGQTLVGLQDWQVSRLVSNNIIINAGGQHLFSSITVSQVNHHFPLQQQPQRARKITLAQSQTSIAFESIRAFSLQLFSPNRASERYRDFPSHVNASLVGAFIAHNASLHPDDIQEAVGDLQIMANRCMTFTMYISDDCQCLEVEVPQENLTVIRARQAGFFLNAFFMKMFGWVQAPNL